MLSAVGALVAVAAALIITSNAVVTLVATRHRRRHPPPCTDDDDPRPRTVRVVAALRLFLVECGAHARAALTPPTPAPPPSPRRGTRRPVLLLHDRGLHRGSLHTLARALRRAGWGEVHTARHRPLGDPDASAERVADAVADVRRATAADAVDVVAHGASGLIARACVRTGGRRSGIGRLITLGAPHQGTAAPWTARWERAGAAWLTALAARDPVPTLVDCTAIHSADDARIVPASNGYYPGAFNVEVRGVGHAGLLFSPRIRELVCENLGADAPAERVARE